MSTGATTTGILVLAAGRGRRFGRDKRLARLPRDGGTLLQATIAAARGSGLPLRVCLRPGDALLAQRLAMPDVTTVICHRAGDGMGATLSEAVAGIHQCWHGVVIALGDMPWVSGDTYRALARSCVPSAIVVPHYKGQRGNPVCFGSDWFPALLRCEGDLGARDILRAQPDAVIPLEVDDAGILQDVDYPDDIDARR